MKPRPWHKRWRDALESRLVQLLAWAARFVPVALGVRCGAALGGLLGRVDRRRRVVALENLELAYGATLDAAARRRIVAGVYRHLGRFFVEYLLLLAKPKLRPLSRFVALEGGARAKALVEQHGSAIFVTLHQGHWELLGGVVTEQVAPLHAVMKPLRNAALNERLVALRSRLGMALIDRENAVVSLFRCLRRGQSVALLCDLNQKESPAFVDFFGVPAATVRTPAVLALRTGKPILVVSSWSRGRPLDYAAAFAEPIVPDLAADPDLEEARLLRELNGQLEAFVRAHPEQWNWIHPRWKTRPPRDHSSAGTPRAS